MLILILYRHGDRGVVVSAIAAELLVFTNGNSGRTETFDLQANDFRAEGPESTLPAIQRVQFWSRRSYLGKKKTPPGGVEQDDKPMRMFLMMMYHMDTSPIRRECCYVGIRAVRSSEDSSLRLGMFWAGHIKTPDNVLLFKRIVGQTINLDQVISNPL